MDPRQERIWQLHRDIDNLADDAWYGGRLSPAEHMRRWDIKVAKEREIERILLQMHGVFINPNTPWMEQPKGPVYAAMRHRNRWKWPWSQSKALLPLRLAKLSVMA